MEIIARRAYFKHSEYTGLHGSISADVNNQVADFIIETIHEKDKRQVVYFPSVGEPREEIEIEDIDSLIDLKRLNQTADFNSTFKAINKLLPQGGIYIGCFESYENRRDCVYDKYNRILGFLVLVKHFLFKRFLPKWELSRDMYRYLVKDRYTIYSLAEALGRLAFCGFAIADYKVIDNLTYFIALKTSEPRSVKDPAFNTIFKMKRIGKGGRVIDIYKLRTMYHYSEFIQDYVVKINGYDAVGKPNKDFRITAWGRFIRRFWIDEIPQFINVLKGDLNLIGPRPIGKFLFDSYPKDLQEGRIRYKPGLIPPQVALRKKGLDGVLESERQYLDDRKKNPFKTQVTYFLKAVFNILTLRVRGS